MSTAQPPQLKESRIMHSLRYSRIVAILLGVVSSVAGAQTLPPATQSGYVRANGVSYYYEVRGQGEPLLLLHGGLGNIAMFAPGIPELAKTRQVIAVDLYGHGRTALTDRRMSYVDVGNDMATLIRELGHRQVDVLGYSMGGGIAFRLAAQHPQLVRRLVLVSTPFAQSGFYPEMLPQQAAVSGKIADQFKGTPIYDSYMAVAPRKEDFPRLLDIMGELMRTPYDWSEDVKKLTMPTLLVFGDSDMFRLEHEIEFYKLLGGGQQDAGWMRQTMARNRLAILPNVTHYEMATAPAFVPTVLPFLNGETGGPPPAAQTQRGK
jgi:pimeloyl-ACP methyl ester carboxylesterase